MMTIDDAKPLSEITHDAIAVLCKEIGVANTIRFINQFTKGYGNYTEERAAMFENLTMEEYELETEKMRASRESRKL
jgi:transposase-like protein